MQSVLKTSSLCFDLAFVWAVWRILRAPSSLAEARMSVGLPPQDPHIHSVVYPMYNYAQPQPLQYPAAPKDATLEIASPTSQIAHDQTV